MNTDQQDPKIKEFWNQQAREHQTGAAASWADVLVEREIRTLRRYTLPLGRILDAGCANGYSTVPLLLGTNEIVGIDYAEEMIQQANHLKASLPASLQQRLHFQVGDVLTANRLFPPKSFDQIVVKRVIINLDRIELQYEALRSLAVILKDGGQLLLSEASEQGLQRVNAVRKRMRLELMQSPWFNTYLDEEDLARNIRPLFTIERVVNFSSTYYFGSRVVYAWFAKLLKRQPVHGSWLNKAAVMLPALGNFGIQKLFILRKINTTKNLQHG